MSKKYRSYTDKEICAYLESFRAVDTSARDFARKINVPLATFCRWKRNSDDCSAPRNPKNKRMPLYSDVEDQLFAWFSSEREKGLVVTRAELQDKAIEIAADLKIAVFKASAGWLTRFIKRKLPFRTQTPHARKAVVTKKDLQESKKDERRRAKAKEQTVVPSGKRKKDFTWDKPEVSESPVG